MKIIKTILFNCVIFFQFFFLPHFLIHLQVHQEARASETADKAALTGAVLEQLGELLEDSQIDLSARVAVVEVIGIIVSRAVVGGDKTGAEKGFRILEEQLRRDSEMPVIAASIGVVGEIVRKAAGADDTAWASEKGRQILQWASEKGRQILQAVYDSHIYNALLQTTLWAVLVGLEKKEQPQEGLASGQRG